MTTVHNWLTLAALAAVVLFAPYAAPARAAGEAAAVPSPEMRRHLEPYADYLAEQMARHAASLSEEEKYREFIVHLEPAGPVVNPADVPGGYALYETAVYCAVLTGDFQVTLGEILNAGLWPYATFPAELDLNLAVADNPEFHTFQASLLEGIGTPEWLAWHKAQLLLSFYRDFFFRPPSGRERSAVDLGQPLAQFWINPYTGAPMAEGTLKGDLSVNDVEVLRVDFSGVVPASKAVRELVLVPFINTIDQPEFELDLPASFMRSRPG